ncbi:MAG TPA: copper transporter [Actinomycetota bacterium]|nr:copper transporter [Actinomycetota bacterium]
MISFRYHIVTIVALFLALAIGLLAGSAFVEPGLVEQLRTQTDRLRGEVGDLEDELTAARAEVAGLEAFADAAASRLSRDRLLGTNVVIVTLEGTDGGLIARAQASLSEAGATILAMMSARSTLLSDDPAVQAELAEILGRPDALPVDLPGLAAGALAERLDRGRRPTDPEDLLSRLLSAGFLAPVGIGVSGATIEQIGQPGQAVVVLAGGAGEDPPLEPEAFAVPLVRALAALGVVVAAGEPLDTDVPFVRSIRAAGDPGTVTVDDLDRSMGGAALVLGLGELLTTGSGGAYGVKDGAEPIPSAT